jgi:hypothetical protein
MQPASSGSSHFACLSTPSASLPVDKLNIKIRQTMNATESSQGIERRVARLCVGGIWSSGSNSNSQRHMMRPVVSLAVAATLLAGALAQDLCTNLNIGTTSGDDDVMSFGVVRTPCLLQRTSPPHALPGLRLTWRWAGHACVPVGSGAGVASSRATPTTRPVPGHYHAPSRPAGLLLRASREPLPVAGCMCDVTHSLPAQLLFPSCVKPHWLAGSSVRHPHHHHTADKIFRALACALVPCVCGLSHP